MGVLSEARDNGYVGGVCLSHFNEPLMDERLPDIAKRVREEFTNISILFLNTNGDYITEELAASLDGVLDRIIVTLYMDEPIKSKRRDWISSLFKLTDCQIITESQHIPSHYSPKFDVPALISKHIDNNCIEPATRAILNHRGQWLLCCEDLVGNFHLGSYPKTSFMGFWQGTKHVEIYKTLQERHSRQNYKLCSVCPKT
jgi:hypothetical protein